MFGDRVESAGSKWYTYFHQQMHTALDSRSWAGDSGSSSTWRMCNRCETWCGQFLCHLCCSVHKRGFARSYRPYQQHGTLSLFIVTHSGVIWVDALHHRTHLLCALHLATMFLQHKLYMTANPYILNPVLVWITLVQYFFVITRWGISICWDGILCFPCASPDICPESYLPLQAA